MEVNLNDLLREAAKRGLTHLSLSPVHSADGKKVYWHATASPSTVHKYISTTSLDPTEALIQVLTALPKAPKRGPRATDLIDTVTAAVNLADGQDTALAQDDSGEPPSPPPAMEQPQSEIDKWLPKT